MTFGTVTVMSLKGEGQIISCRGGSEQRRASVFPLSNETLTFLCGGLDDRKFSIFRSSDEIEPNCGFYFFISELSEYMCCDAIM